MASPRAAQALDGRRHRNLRLGMGRREELRSRISRPAGLPLALLFVRVCEAAQERIRASAQERREMRAVNGDDFYLSDQALLAPFSHATLPSASSRPVLRPFTMVAP